MGRGGLDHCVLADHSTIVEKRGKRVDADWPSLSNTRCTSNCSSWLSCTTSVSFLVSSTASHSLSGSPIFGSQDDDAMPCLKTVIEPYLLCPNRRTGKINMDASGMHRHPHSFPYLLSRPS